jgi:hypothetical protein
MSPSRHGAHAGNCGRSYGLTIRRSVLHLPLVRLLKIIIALLLVALWLPASSHALLEHFGLIHQTHAGHTHHDDEGEGSSHEHGSHNHHAADGLMIAPAGKVKSPAPEFVATPVWLTALLWTAPGLAPPHATPVELSRRWQFVSRAALPVRAPSSLAS